MKRLIIAGASGFGREVLQWAKEINFIKGEWDEISFIDDNLNALDGYECNTKVIDTIENYQPRVEDDFVIAIAHPPVKEAVVAKLEERGANFISLIHPDARIGEFNKIGRGVVIYPSARVTANVEIGDFVTLLDTTTIGHDAKIGKYTTICGGCGINGHVVVGEKVFIGSHVTTAPSTKVGDGAYVGTGSVIVTNVKAGNRVFGNPARKIML